MRPALATAALIPFLMTSTRMPAQQTTTLSALRDHRRVLLIFGGDHDPLAAQQWAVMREHRAQATERDLTAVLLTPARVDSDSGEGAPSVRFAAAEDQALRRRFGVNVNQFTVLLVGKDGGEKLRSTHPIDWKTLQQTIDAMPMRRDEMRRSR